MAHDVIIHGEFVQFNGQARCEACQAKDLKCALQQSDDGCMACAGAMRECVFTRSLVITGSKSAFEWDVLLNKDRRQSAVSLRSLPPAMTSGVGMPYHAPDRNRQHLPSMNRMMHQPPVHMVEGRTGTFPVGPGRSITPPVPERSQPRSGIDPPNRAMLGEVPSLADQWRRQSTWRPIQEKLEHSDMQPIRLPPRPNRDQIQRPNTMETATVAHIQPKPEFKAEFKGEFKPFHYKNPDAAAHQLLASASETPRTHEPVPPKQEGIDFYSLPPSFFRTEYSACREDIRQANPQLQGYLLERLAHEQVRRFEKLGSLKSDHVKARRLGQCPSDIHCLDEKNYLRWLEVAQEIENRSRSPVATENSHDPPSRRATETNTSRQGSPSELGDADVEAAENITGPSTFPSGYPIPPHQNFPAEFECPLCFRVKKYYKPSDWIKHVHEDIQPFVCTFEHCSEPKAFKRKADWVRHENERHRQLEWWICNLPDCMHKCFRKDNFIQHLVREHKMPEPRIRPSHSSSAAPKPQDHEAADDKLWRLSMDAVTRRQKVQKTNPAGSAATCTGRGRNSRCISQSTWRTSPFLSGKDHGERCCSKGEPEPRATQDRGTPAQPHYRPVCSHASSRGEVDADGYDERHFARAYGAKPCSALQVLGRRLQ